MNLEGMAICIAYNWLKNENKLDVKYNSVVAYDKQKHVFGVFSNISGLK